MEVSLEQKEDNLIKKTCQELGLNQKQLAEKTGFDPSVISRWNKGAKISLTANKYLNLLIKYSKLEKKCFELEKN